MPDAIQQFSYNVDLLKALLWQYNDAVNLQALLEAKDTWYANNETAFWTDWYTNVFNLETADAFGLAVWSIILNQPLYVNGGTAAPQSGIFGLGSYNQNLNNGNFGPQSGQTYQFSLETSRLLLRLRYYQLTSSGTVPEINRMLKSLFSKYGFVYLVDNHDMTQQYLFYFTIPSEILLMLTSFDVLPRPAGVQSIIQETTVVPFGLGSNNANFTNGNFFGGTFQEP